MLAKSKTIHAPLSKATAFPVAVLFPGDFVVQARIDIESVAHLVTREHDYAVATACGRVFGRAEVMPAPPHWTDVCYRCDVGQERRHPSDLVTVSRITFDALTHLGEQARCWNDPFWQNLPAPEPAEDFGMDQGDQWIAQEKASLRLYLICCDRGPRFIKRKLTDWAPAL